MNYLTNPLTVDDHIDSILSLLESTAVYVSDRIDEENDKVVYVNTMKKCKEHLKNLSVKTATAFIIAMADEMANNPTPKIFGLKKVPNKYGLKACRHALAIIKSVDIRYVSGTPKSDLIIKRQIL
jgi:hypothetical protein